MKALVYTAAEALSYQDVDTPTPGDGEALIRIDSVGICGSDMHAFLGHDERRPAPLILGHEAAGTVVGGAQDGVRVTINPLVSCGECSACTEGRSNLCPTRQIISLPPREGAFAEWLTMPTENLVQVPDAVTLAKASLAEPIACGWHAVRLAEAALFGALADARCLVIGGGPIGVGAALALKAFGAHDVTVAEPNALRRDYLHAQGELCLLPPDELDGQYDVVIDGVGYAATRAQATAVVKPGGVVMHIGLGSADDGLDVRRMTLQEITFIGTYTYTPDDFRATCAAMFDGRLGALDWTETRALADGAAAFADIRAGRNPAPKIILTPPTEDRAS